MPLPEPDEIYECRHKFKSRFFREYGYILPDGTEPDLDTLFDDAQAIWAEDQENDDQLLVVTLGSGISFDGNLLVVDIDATAFDPSATPPNGLAAPGNYVFEIYTHAIGADPDNWTPFADGDFILEDSLL